MGTPVLDEARTEAPAQARVGAAVDAAAFRAAMAGFPSGVTVVTALDRWGTPHGFTASSFCSVSLDPPLILVCLAADAYSYPVFASCEDFAVSILGEDQQDLAQRFATRGIDKFSAGGFGRTPGGLPVADGALVGLDCAVHERHLVGDHLVLVGRVGHAEVREGAPMVHFGSRFRGLAPVRTTTS